MPIGEISYRRPRTLMEACELGRTFGGEGRFLAGGTELIVDLRHKRDSCDYIISLQDIRELREIRLIDGLLHIGALCTMTEIAASAAVRKVLPILGRAAAMMGNEQIRNRATIGGNFARAVPCADTPPACIVGGGRVRLVGAEEERWFPAEEFFTGPRETVLRSGELVAEIQIPSSPVGTGASYQRFGLRNGSSVAVASVAASVTLADGRIESARMALGAVAPVPLLAHDCMQMLQDQEAAPGLFAEAGRVAAAEARPISDIRGSEQYRRELIAVLATRALEEAVGQARSA